MNEAINKPILYDYYEIRKFIVDWISYSSKVNPEFSLRELSRLCGFGSGLLPMVLGNKRTLTRDTLVKLLPHFKLSPPEKRYLEALRVYSEAKDTDTRSIALNKLSCLRGFKKNNPNEKEAFTYLSRWYFIAIREMAFLEGFKLDTKWVQSRLQGSLAKSEIELALKFLFEDGYLKKIGEKVVVTEKQIDCHPDMFRAAIAEFHKEMLKKASESITATNREKRNLLGHTFALSLNDFEKVKEIMNEAISKIKVLGESKNTKDQIYQLEFVAFPLTKEEL